MRRFVFSIFLFLAATACLFALIVIVTNIVRYAVFGTVHWVTYEATPRMLREVIRDPVLIPAAIIAAIFVWSFPWEKYLGDVAPGDDFRRGRRVHGAREAELQAFKDLVRRRNKDRSRHR